MSFTKITSRVIAPGAVTAEALAPGVGGGPAIANVQIANSSYSVLDDTAVSLSGGYIIINGENFDANVQVLVGNTVATSVTYVSQNQIRAEVGAAAAGSKIVYLVNTDTGATAIRVNGLTYSGTPTWVTDSTLAEGTVDDLITIQLSATSDSNVSYSLASGSSLPSGLSLAANGLLSGTVTGLEDDTLYNFTIEATDEENQESPRSFSVTITVADEYFKETVLLLNGDRGNTWITDASSNNFTITPYNDVKSSSFTPFLANWSNFFDGNGDYISTPSEASLNSGTNDFTIECWVYVTSNPTTAYPNIVSSTNWNIGTGGVSLRYGNTGYANKFTFHWYNVGDPFLTSSTTFAINSWHHVAITRSGNSFTLWINGVSQASGTSSLTVDWNLNSAGMKIGGGNWDNTNSWFPGYISNLRLVNGTCLYTTSFTPSTTPLTAVANTVLLTCQSNRPLDNSNNNLTITNSGDVKIKNYSPFSEVETTDGSAYFDGNNDYLTCSADTSFDVTSSDFTMEAWIYRTSSGSLQNIFGYRLDGPARGWEFRINADSSLSFFYTGGSSVTTAASSVPINQWVHVAASRSGSTTKLFINGSESSSASFSNGTSVSTTLYIGISYDFTGDFQGYICNARIIKNSALYTENFTPSNTPFAAISNTSLLTLQNKLGHNNNNFLDNSGFRHIINRGGNVTQGSFSPFSPSGWSVYFDGTGDALTIPDSPFSQLGNSDFTVECWFRTNRTAECNILTKGVDVNVTWGNFSLLKNSSGYLRFYIDPTPGNSADQFQLVDTVSIHDGQWHHVALTRSGNNWRLFRDGILGASGTSSAAFSDDAYTWVVGGMRTSGSVTGDWQGEISNLRLIKGNALYTDNFTVPTEPLQPVSNTAFLVCNSNRFEDDGPYRFSITRNADVSVVPISPFSTHTVSTNSYSGYFDGTGDYLTVADSPSLELSNNDWCLEFWIYHLGDAGYFISKRSAGGSNYGPLVLTSDASGSITIYMSSTGSSFNIYSNQPAGSVTLRAWTHYALYRSGSNLYYAVNGTVTSITSSFSATLVDQSTPWVFGGDTNGDWMNCYLSNIRLNIGSSVYGADNFTVSNTPLTAIENTQLLICQSETFVDNSNNSFTITENGNVISTRFNPFGRTVTNNVLYSPALHGSSAYFDGSGDYLNIPYTPEFLFGTTDDFTMECWYYPINFTNGHTFIGSYPSGSNGNWLLILQASGNFYLYIFNTGNTNVNGETFFGSGAQLKSWNHLCVTRSGTTFKIYVNGIEKDSVTTSLGFGNVNNSWTVGSYVAGSTSSQMYGYISDLRVVKGTAIRPAVGGPERPLSVVKNTIFFENYQNASIIDSTTKNVLETVGNAQIDTTTKKFGTGSMEFDGTGDYLLIPNTPSLGLEGNFTVEAWVYLTANPPPAGNGAYLIDFRVTSTNNFALGFIESSGVTKMYGFVGSGPVGITGSTTVSLNAWNHVAYVRSGSTITLYLNGTANGTMTSSYSQPPTAATIASRFTGATEYITGLIDDLRITKGVARYTSNFTAPTRAHKLK